MVKDVPEQYEGFKKLVNNAMEETVRFRDRKAVKGLTIAEEMICKEEKAD